MKETVDKQILTEFETKCRKANLKITPQRTAIYEELIKSKEHPSATVLYTKIRNKYPHISLDTVNRTLLTFAKVGLASILAGSGEDKRFDGGLEDHQHFHCIRCNKIIDFSCKELENIKLPAEIRENFTVLAKTIYLEGLCRQCKKETCD